MVASVPVSVDLLGSATVVTGPRSLQLAVVRHAVLSLAVASSPEHLGIQVVSAGDELSFADRLPHAAEAGLGAPRRLLVVDRPHEHGRSAGGRAGPEGSVTEVWSRPDVDPATTAVLVLAGPGDLAGGALPGAGDPATDRLRIVDETSISVTAGDGPTPVVGATPVGFAAPMADELVDHLLRHHPR